MPGNTFVATWLAARRAGATPVPVDPDPATFNLDPDGRRGRDHLAHADDRPGAPLRRPAAMDAVRAVAARHGLFVLEDAAQAHGARFRGNRAGALADAAAWSFYPSKNLGALGDGGAVTTDDDGLAERLRMLRNYGSSAKYRHEVSGVNSRLDELQAAVLRVKLEQLDAWNERRRSVAARYGAGLAESELVLPRRPGRRGARLAPVRRPDAPARRAPPCPRGLGSRDRHPLPARAAPPARVRRPRDRPSVATGVGAPPARGAQPPHRPAPRRRPGRPRCRPDPSLRCLIRSRSSA